MAPTKNKETYQKDGVEDVQRGAKRRREKTRKQRGQRGGKGKSNTLVIHLPIVERGGKDGEEEIVVMTLKPMRLDLVRPNHKLQRGRGVGEEEEEEREREVTTKPLCSRNCRVCCLPNRIPAPRALPSLQSFSSAWGSLLGG